MNYIDYFKEISAIPRESGNEKAIAEYLTNFAILHKLDYYTDELHNVLIRKPASTGFKYAAPIMLQSHVDMVCEKNNSTDHDFKNEGIKLIESDGFITADGTTLGADNGIGIAYMLAILSGDNFDTLQHPMLECLFTVQEEIGLVGADKFNFADADVKSKRIINLDSEDETTAIISSAGGVRTTLNFDYDLIPANSINKTIIIQITGLAGGHSGMDIHLGRGNAIIIMGRILNKIYADCPFNLVSINGGLKSNAIPRECEAIINVTELNRVTALIRSIEKEIRDELIADDKNFRVTIKKSITEKVMTFKSTSVLITALMLSLNGFISHDSSSNLGVITINANDSIELRYENRSSIESTLDHICEKYDRLAYTTGMKIIHTNRYPGWKYNPVSQLKNDYCRIFNALYGCDPIISGIHAGLECGLIINRIGDIAADSGIVDAISIGPNISGAHTPDETLDIESCRRVWNILIEMIRS